jgi:dienelactone hydrolase
MDVLIINKQQRSSPMSDRIMPSHRLIGTFWSVLLLGLLAATACAEVQTKTIEYQHDGTVFRGYLAWDEAIEGQRPGVLVVHEWWGLNDYARQRARQLAELGYVAFAADMYGEGKTVDHPQEAGQMAAQVRANVQQWRGRATEALSVLKSQPHCDPERLAVIGYCFGGSTALQLAYSGADIDAVATFHAALPAPTPAEAQQIKAQLLINHGADDPFIAQDAIDTFRKTLDQAQARYEFVSYPGARHSFTVPSADAVGSEGMKYDESADKQSWNKMKTLFSRTLER